MKKIVSKVKLFLIVAAVLLLCCCGVFFGTKHYYSKQNRIEVVKEVPNKKITEKATQISGETIRGRMANIGELCTAEYSYTHVEHVDSSREIKGFKIPFTTSKFIYSYDGVIKAGIDFTDVTIDKNDTEKIITVTLPDVKIISSDVDPDSFQIYDEKNNIFNPISVTDVADSFADLKNSEETKAIEKGLFDRAEASATLFVENLMHSAYDVEDYEIKVSFSTNP